MAAERSSTRVVFFGTPEFAVPSFDACFDLAEVVGVVCQPDRPAGRGLTLTPPPVKRRALERGIEVYQPLKVKTGELAAWVRDKSADVAVVVAYGRILPKDVLDAPRLGCVNVHGSILPKYRGAAPIQWAVLEGERETGVSLMRLDEGMDTGDVLSIVTTTLGPDETAGELGERLALLGAEMLRRDLPRYVGGELRAVPQDHAQATYARVLEKSDGRIDWSQSARRIHDHVRGSSPWPGAFTQLASGAAVKVLASRVAPIEPREAAPGEVIIADKTRLIVACGQGAVSLEQVQLEGRKPVRGVDWVMGRGVKERDRLGLC